MEEILASIRRIISEDDSPPAGEAEAASPEEPAAVAAGPEPEPEPEPEPVHPAVEPEPVVASEPEPAPAVEEEALELTDKVETHGDLDVFPAPAPAPEPFTPPPAPSEALVSEPAAAAAASAFGQLTAAMSMPEEVIVRLRTSFVSCFARCFSSGWTKTCPSSSSRPSKLKSSASRNGKNTLNTSSPARARTQMFYFTLRPAATHPA